MFEIGWLELLVIAVVLIVVVGPKDLPGMLRTFGRVSGQMRRMAGDFRRQFDDAIREAELDEVRKAAGDLKSLDPRNDIRKAMNPMKAVGDEIRSSLKAATAAPEAKVPSGTQAAQPMEALRPADSPAADHAMPAPEPAAALPQTASAVAAASSAASAQAGEHHAAAVSAVAPAQADPAPAAVPAADAPDAKRSAGDVA